MKRFLRRWLELEQKRPPPAPPSSPPVPSSGSSGPTLKQYGELLERVDYLQQALNRLRGRVTGADAHKGKEEPSLEDAPGPTIDEQPMVAMPDRWQQLSESKRRKRGVLQG